MLTRERLREVLTYDPETGEFRWIGGRLRGSIAGSIRKDGYVRIGIDGSKVMAHRLAWLYVHGVYPSVVVDHRNGVRSDNRIDNLRDATRSVNGQNQRKGRSGSRSGLLGVSRHHRGIKWVATISVGGRNRKLGMFDTPEDAHAAYVTEKRRVHEGCSI